MAQRRSSRADAVRALLRAQRAGVLCTASARDGAPFGSLASYALSERGEPLFLFSSLAQHTQNLAADPRAALFVHEALGDEEAEDPQTSARACLVGRVEPVPGSDLADARARYLARHPHAAQWLELDFAFQRLVVEEVHWVGGFAQAGWVAAAEILDE